MTKGNLYYYFKDKQDILYQCHMRCISLRALKQAMAADGSAGENSHLLVGHIHACWRRFRQHPADRPGKLLAGSAQGVRQQTGSARKRGVRALIEDGLVRRIRVRQRQARGLLDPWRHQLDTEVVSANGPLAATRSRTAWWTHSAEAGAAPAPRQAPHRGGDAATARIASHGRRNLGVGDEDELPIGSPGP